MMQLVFLHGPPGVGKLTIARSLHELTGFRFFHNHLVVDALLAVFPFGSPSFARLREQFWLEVFEAAAVDGISCIFTFAPEKTVQPAFIARTVQVVERRGGTVRFVGLTCGESALARRIGDPSRRVFGKLQTLQELKALEREGTFLFPAIESELVLDTTSLSPTESALRIAASLRLAARDRNRPNGA